MPTCSEAYGEGWVGTYPVCMDFSWSKYGDTTGDDPGDIPGNDPPPGNDPFGTVDSLGYGKTLEGSKLEDDWQKYFDEYDPEAAERLKKDADTDIAQLGEVWGLRSQQLGASLGLQTSKLGSEAGFQLGSSRQTGTTAAKKSGMSYSGTAVSSQRGAERNIMGQYGRGLEAGKSAYEQAMATGELALQQGTTDIGQKLESGIFGLEKDWEKDQRATLNMLYGRDIWPDDTTSTTDTTPPGGGGISNPYDPSDEIEDIADITTENPPEESCPTGCVQGYSGCVNIVTGQPC